MRRAASLRRRLDDLRARFEPERTAPAASLTDAVDRLAVAVERHFAEQLGTQQTADRLLHALDVVPQGIVLADGSAQIVFRNRAASEFFTGRHSEALVESAIADLIASAVAGTADTRTLELYGPPRRALQLRAVPLHEDLPGSPPVGAFLVVDDVSERQRLDAVRRDFVANISHELKTPVGALSLLAETLVDEDDREVSRRLAGRMVNEAMRLANTIEDLLVLSRIESEEAPEREVVPIHEVVAEAVTRITPAAEQAGIEIAVDEPDAHLAVMGDRRQLVSAIYNLLDNAVKYSDADSVIDVGDGTDGRRVDITVADHGIGIPSRDLERVFERFYRVDVARSRQTGGTGLGLSIVRHVVANHDGEVTVDSRLGEGSTFTLRLPLTATGPVAIDRGVGAMSAPAAEASAG